MLGAWLEANPATELLAPLRLNMVCCRYVPEGLDAGATDQFNCEGVTHIQQDGRAFLTPTAWGDKRAIRFAFDNSSTSPPNVEMLIQAVSMHSVRT